METPITPSITNADRFLASELDAIQRFAGAAAALSQAAQHQAWRSVDKTKTDPMADHLYWGAYAAERAVCEVWRDLLVLGRLPMAYHGGRMWLAVEAEKQGGAA